MDQYLSQTAALHVFKLVQYRELGLKPDLVFNPSIVASTTLDPFAFLSVSFLLLIIASIALWIGSIFYSDTIFKGSCALHLRSTREEDPSVRQCSMSTASPAAPAYSESLQDF